MTHVKEFRKFLAGKCSHRSNLAIRRSSWQNGLLWHPTHQPPTVKYLRAREMICLPWGGSSRRKYARTFNDDSGNIETLYNFLFFIKTSKTKFKPATPEFSQVVNKGKLKKVKFKIFQILKKKTLNIHEISKMSQRKGTVEWSSIHFSEARGRILFCGHADPAFLFSSQDSTKIQGLERPFKTRITGFYWLYKWIR